MIRERWTHIRGVLLDLYGTLLIYGDMEAAERAWCEAQHTTLQEHGLDISLDEFQERTRGMFEAPPPAPAPEGSDLTLNERRLRVFYRELGVSVPGDEMRRMDVVAQDAWQSYIALDPAAKDVLTESRRSKSVVLVSNYDHPPHVRRVLADVDLNPHFDCVVISGDVGVEKPDPRIFAPALEATGLAPGEVVYVGDATVDVDGAAAAGIASIRIDRDRDVWTHPREADHVIHGLSELLPLLV